jgi:hypothetical protein
MAHGALARISESVERRRRRRRTRGRRIYS